ncbi:SRPBCC family protein [Leptospira sarikeiensis]|uniref:Polyketide cyclase n=1 Tax=Leptospira sarikeiensis TaxID=2484943 RepID=A0A4R9K9J2_9LEPT|nr:SRPBCC family protein [Leptospira sarikeiensis]TGL63314.1 polyketide cyclase [Leptospira sarikeiensis]
MKVLKIILYSLLGIMVLILVIAVFLSKTFKIQEEIVIDKPKQEVFNYIKILNNQVQYAKWFMLDPETEFSSKGTDGELGFIHSWKSKNENVGIGEQEIIKKTEGELLGVEIRFQWPFESKDSAYTKLEPISDHQTKLISVFEGKMDYPMNLMIPIICGDLGEDLRGNLARLKSIIENEKRSK